MGSVKKLSTFYINDPEWAQTLQRDVDEYMMRLQDSIDEDDPEFESLSGIPYCGCTDCYWREVLVFISPKIMQGQNEKKIELA